MSLELILTSGIVILAIFILYKNIKRKSQGKCDCGSCSSHCPQYKKDNNDK